MRETWKAEMVKELYQYEITREELATEMGVSVSYVNMILTGARKGELSKAKMLDSLKKLKKQKTAKQK